MADDIEKEHFDMFSREDPPEPPVQTGKGAQKGNELFIFFYLKK